jgi:hypothetical protein
MNNLALIGGLTALGMNSGSAIKDYAFGGFPRMVSGLDDFLEGMWDNNPSRRDEGLRRMMTPAIFDVPIQIGEDIWRFAHGEINMGNLTNQVLTAPYLPMRKAVMTADALKSALTNSPVPVFNRKTGLIDSWIQPDKALAAAFFGSRSESYSERSDQMNFLQKQQALQLSDRNKLSKTASMFIQDIESAGTLDQKRKTFAAWEAKGIFSGEDGQKMVKAVLDQYYSKEFYQSDSLFRNLQTLDAKHRIPYLVRYLPKDDPKLRDSYLIRLSLMGLLGTQELDAVVKAKDGKQWDEQVDSANRQLKAKENKSVTPGTSIIDKTGLGGWLKGMFDRNPR